MQQGHRRDGAGDAPRWIQRKRRAPFLTVARVIACSPPVAAPGALCRCPSVAEMLARLRCLPWPVACRPAPRPRANYCVTIRRAAYCAAAVEHFGEFARFE